MPSKPRPPNGWNARLDDSANRRLSLPLSFLTTDAVLILYRNIAEGLVVYPHVIAKNLNEELPFMATEEILMAGVQAGGDRQQLHEVIRTHSLAAADHIKMHGGPNDLLSRLKSDPSFANARFEEYLDASRFIGRAPGTSGCVSAKRDPTDSAQIPQSGRGRPGRDFGLIARSREKQKGERDREDSNLIPHPVIEPARKIALSPILETKSAETRRVLRNRFPCLPRLGQWLHREASLPSNAKATQRARDPRRVGGQ